MIDCLCGESILKAYPSGKAKLRASILIMKADGLAIAVCKKCKAEIEVPIKLTKAIPHITEMYVVRGR